MLEHFPAGCNLAPPESLNRATPLRHDGPQLAPENFQHVASRGMTPCDVVERASYRKRMEMLESNPSR